MLKVRNNPMMGTIISLAGLVVFAVSLLMKAELEGEFWLVIGIGLANIFAGFFLLTQTRLSVSVKEVTVNNMIGRTLATYPLDRATALWTKGENVVMEKDGKEVVLGGITKSACNKKDWEELEKMIQEREAARLGKPREKPQPKATEPIE